MILKRESDISMKQNAPNTACSRLALRAVFQGYFRVVIVIRGAGVVRRIRQAADAYVRRPSPRCSKRAKL
jgi:hypothetical protein